MQKTPENKNINGKKNGWKGKSEIENLYNFMCVVCFSSIIIWNQHPQLKIIKTAKKYFYDLIFKAAKKKKKLYAGNNSHQKKKHERGRKGVSENERVKKKLYI